MKKYIFIIAAVAAILSSCNKDAMVENNTKDAEKVPELVEMSFTATSAFTRAVLNSDRSVSFSAGDKIAVFANGNKYIFTTTDGGANALFTGSAEVASTYYALFPYSDGAEFDTTTETITGVNLSNTSTIGTPGSFQSGKPIFVAKTTGGNLEFKSAVALLKITVPEGVTDLKELYIFNRQSSLAGAVTGTADITLTGDTPAVAVQTANTSPHTVGLSAPTNKTLKAGDYYLPVFPSTLTNGFDMKLSYLDALDGNNKPIVGTIGRTGNGSLLTFEAGKVYNLGTIYKMAGYVYNSFESGSIGETIAGGNSSSLSVISNPVQDERNSSARVLSLNMSGRSPSSPTSGAVSFLPISTDKFPTSETFRDFFRGISLKFYSADVYYPRFTVKDNGTEYEGSSRFILPSRVNGDPITDKASFDAAYKTNYWNILEWDHVDMSSYVSTGFKKCQGLKFKFFIDDEYNNLSTDGHGLLCYIDDISFYL